jgi:hypothetical protein
MKAWKWQRGAGQGSILTHEPGENAPGFAGCGKTRIHIEDPKAVPQGLKATLIFQCLRHD